MGLINRKNIEKIADTFSQTVLDASSVTANEPTLSSEFAVSGHYAIEAYIRGDFEIYQLSGENDEPEEKGISLRQVGDSVSGQRTLFRGDFHASGNIRLKVITDTIHPVTLRVVRFRDGVVLDRIMTHLENESNFIGNVVESVEEGGVGLQANLGLPYKLNILGMVNHTTLPREIGVDGGLNIYSSSNTRIIKYSRYGNPVNELNINEGNITSIYSRNEDIYVGTQTGKIVKLDSDLNQVWLYDSGESGFNFATIHANASGEVVAGRYNGHQVVKLNSDGTLAWTSTAEDGEVYRVRIDNDGDVYSVSLNVVVKKLASADGAEIWRQAELPNGTVADAIEIDRDKNVYVGNRQFLVKLDSNGAIDLTVTMGSRIYSLAIDRNGNLYGSTQNGTVFKADKNDLTINWDFSLHDDRAHFVTTDKFGFIYSIGHDFELHKFGSELQIKGFRTL